MAGARQGCGHGCGGDRCKVMVGVLTRRPGSSKRASPYSLLEGRGTWRESGCERVPIRGGWVERRGARGGCKRMRVMRGSGQAKVGLNV